MFSHFGGNPAVIQLLEDPNTSIDKLLDIDSFPAQFRSCNPKLQKYMDITKYSQLVEYITIVGDPANKNRAYKYPLAAADILSMDNAQTVEAMFRDGKIVVEKMEIEERWVEKEVDECDSEYCSSEGSNKNIDQFFENSTTERQNIAPLSEKINQNNTASRVSSTSSKKKNSDSSSSQGRKSLGASSASITSDDFPFVEQAAKKIKIKQTITRKVEVQIKPLLSQLCQFLQKQVNYTLTGYVVKVFELLFKKNPRKILRQIFTTKAHKFLSKHLESQVMCDFVVNMLVCTENEAENARQFFISTLLKTLVGNSNDESKMILNKGILYILVEVNSKLDPHACKWHAALLNYLNQQSAFTKLSGLIFETKTTNKNREIYAQLLLQYLKKIINPIVINPVNTASSAMRTTQQQSIKQIRHKILAKFEVNFKLFIDRLWENLIDLAEKKSDIPSYVYIKLLEILNVLIKNDLFWARMELANQENTFSPLLQLCHKFNKNNFIHNQVFELLKEIVHQASDMPVLFKKTFCHKSFLNFCLETVCDHSKGSPPMYRGQCIYLCQALRHSHTDEVRSLKTEFKQKWIKIQQSILQNVEKINSTLGGFSVRRPHKTDIQFNKQAIVARFLHFLKGEKPLQKKKSLEESQLQQIASQGSSEWSDWSEFSNYSTDQVDEKEPPTQTQ